jgi:hypothetical protein
MIQDLWLTRGFHSVAFPDRYQKHVDEAAKICKAGKIS